MTDPFRQRPLCESGDRDPAAELLVRLIARKALALFTREEIAEAVLQQIDARETPS